MQKLYLSLVFQLRYKKEGLIHRMPDEKEYNGEMGSLVSVLDRWQ
jgi:hypothetical protein